MLDPIAHITLRPEVHEPRPGLAGLPDHRSVVVVGGGLAGVAAAVVLAERGAAVTLLEAEAQLGGRVRAWPDRLADGTPFSMERGFHAFFRQYYNLRALLERVDPGLSRLVPLDDYPLYGPDGQQESFARLPRHPLAGLPALVWRTSTIGLRDLPRTDPVSALQMLAYDPHRTFETWDHVTATAYLDGLRLPRRARQMLFEVFAHSFFNPEDGMSAAEMLRMFHFYFTGNPEGLIFDVLSQPFSSGLWEPIGRLLDRLGVDVRLETRADRLERAAGGWRVVTGAAALSADAVVLAVTVPALQGIVEASPDLDHPGWRRQVGSLGLTLPFAVWRLWLDRKPRADRAPFAGTAGLGMLDNISIYDRFQDESRAWAARTGGSVVELHAYAVPEGCDEATLRADLWAQATRLYPELAGARIVEDRFLLRQDCPSFAPGAAALRPPPETPIPGVVLAGDFVTLPFPAALMEGAVASGTLAANHLLARWHVRGQVLRSVPRRGLLPRVVGRLPGLLTALGGGR